MTFSIRPHQKSRGGCNSCKARRVKCDENRPICNHCTRRGTECLFTEPQKRRRAAPRVVEEDAGTNASGSGADDSAGVPGVTPTATATPTPPLSTPRPKPRAKARPRPAGVEVKLEMVPRRLDSIPRSPPSAYSPKHLMDLRLMHQYATVTATSISDIFQFNSTAADRMKVDIPRVSQEHEFLMDTILGVAAIHLGTHATPDQPSLVPVSHYRNKALYNVRQATGSLSDQNLRALHMASMLLATTSLAADKALNYSGLWVTNWLVMASGPRVLTESRHTSSAAASQEDKSPAPVHAPGLAPDRMTPAVMPAGLEELLRIDKEDDDWQHRDVLREAANGIAELFGGLCLDPEGGILLQFKVRAWTFSLTSSHFVDLVQQKNPRALVIVAYFLALVSYMPETWLYADVAQRDMAKLVAMVQDPVWTEFLRVPRRALAIDNSVARSDFLRTQLTGQSPATLLSNRLAVQSWSLMAARK